MDRHNSVLPKALTALILQANQLSLPFKEPERAYLNAHPCFKAGLSTGAGRLSALNESLQMVAGSQQLSQQQQQSKNPIAIRIQF